MTIFKKLKTDGLEEAEDRVGGFQPLESDIYDAEIKIAYAGESAGGAKNVTIVAMIGTHELRETIYVTNKQGEPFYADKQDPSKKRPLPGFTTVNDICLLTTGDELADQPTEEKMVKVYNPDERKEVPTPTDVLVNLTGEKIRLGVLEEIVDVRKRQEDGSYRATGDTRTQNSIDAVFHPETGRTVREYLHEIEEPEFASAWEKRNKGKPPRDRTDKSAKGAGGAAGVGRPGAGNSNSPLKKKLLGG